MEDAITLFKDHFQVFARREKPYAVRFIAAPYNDDEANSALVYGVDRDPDRIGGLDVTRLLQKFGLGTDAFKEAYNDFYESRSKDSAG